MCLCPQAECKMLAAEAQQSAGNFDPELPFMDTRMLGGRKIEKKKPKSLRDIAAEWAAARHPPASHLISQGAPPSPPS